MPKRGLNETLFKRSFRTCSSYENFHREIETYIMEIDQYFNLIIIPKTSLIMY